VQRLAVLSLHTSPLAQPGAGDSGGMNVYVRELVSALAQAGVASDVYTRRWASDLPDVVDVEPGFRVVHVPAGPVDLPKEKLPAVVDEFADGVLAHLIDGTHGTGTQGTDALHANYWLSGVAGHRLKHELGLPLVSTFHTLARVKAETGDREPQRRVAAEAEVIGCSDAILASCAAEAAELERLYGADPSRIEIVPPGVVHAFFSPGDRAGARAALHHPAERLGPDVMGHPARSATRGPHGEASWRRRRLDGPVLLFVGRIQPLKGLDVAVRTLAARDAGRRCGRRRAAHAGRPRADRVPRRGQGPLGLRRPRRAHPRRSGPGRPPGRHRRRPGPGLHVVDRRRPPAPHLRRPHGTVPARVQVVGDQRPGR
jgi:D-inositol-3-phosphate glycosyltransferase